VEALEGERHPASSPRALEAALRYCEDVLAGLDLEPRRRPFSFRGRSHANLAATLAGTDPSAPRVLVGAHVDTVRGSPGADDNASGVAGLLEVAREVIAGGRPRAAVDFVVFNLEERQGLTYRVGSRRWAADAASEGVRYAGALVFEMIGFRTGRAGSQRVPLPIRWMDLPRVGDFVACVGDGGSEELVGAFVGAAAAVAPGLRVVTLNVPLRGWLVPSTRRSDNASFWSRGYPAVMITDTADLRNPHYHRSTDRAETLDFDFAADVTAAAAETVRRIAG
jgi:Zn-dependent M28 family amino/carboxypeptidase